ncbi:Gfo/Idh/MocA family protein [Notoacmeibacter ruber]|uniref:Gfo/Idh/MocA family oxidoreductase n=1 Tax=Notoacmeibacter ruber TaxID=2670375 RepID=A0A3L7J3R8_9HYPH|nr:Gfo/Idh/MocA family oxidoreductase [Notoacmeibacter ruber]RLQ85296.1 gfo/Idh/MocA family oxidoreductase [Notoacmeibacter ruber]
MKKTKIGLIGYGEIGRAHAAALAQITESELTAIADPSQAAIKAAESSGTKAIADYRELLADPEIEAVVIATPDHLHGEPAIAAAAAGKHILLEKPIAPTIEQSLKIRQAADEAGVKLMIGHTLRFFPEYQFAKERAASGDLGRLVSVFARRTNIITQSRRIQGRISVLGFLGVHDFDVLRWVVGAEPVRIFCENATSVTHGYDVEDETFTTIRFDNGVVACLHCGWFVPENHPSGFDFKLDITGDKGIVNLDFANAVTTLHGTGGTKQPLLTPALVNENRAFVTALRQDASVPVSADDGMAAVAMVNAAEQSARTGKPVDLDADAWR